MRLFFRDWPKQIFILLSFRVDRDLSTRRGNHNTKRLLKSKKCKCIEEFEFLQMLWLSPFSLHYLVLRYRKQILTKV